MEKAVQSLAGPSIKMFFSSRQFIRSMVLGLMVLFMCASSPAYLGDDDDSDDARPATSIELTAAIPCNKSFHPEKNKTSGSIISSHNLLALAHAGFQSACGPETSSLPLVIPLRT